MPSDTGNLLSSSFREKLAKAAQEYFGKSKVPHIAEDIGEVAVALNSPLSNGQTMRSALSEKAGPSIAERLVLYARKAASFFHTPEREAYATVEIGQHTETYPVRSRHFKLWLQSEFWRREKDKIEDALLEAEGALFDGAREVDLPEVVREQALTDAIRQVEGLAIFEGHEQEVFVRVAGDERTIYIDLGDEEWQAVEIDQDGWRVISDPPVQFVRPKGLVALPEPRKGGSTNQLRALLNMPDDEEGEQNWRLLLAWMAQSFLPSGPYPVLVLLGPQGSAKTTVGRILRKLVDPSTVLDRGVPRDEHNLFIEGVSNWVISIDNLSGLPGWLSDALCRLSTGGGFSTRTLYENRDQELFTAMRPVILTGIADVVTRPDLLDRFIIINLPAIPKEKRRLEKKVYADLERVAPEILGFIFSAIARGLSTVENVSLDGLPRMADFATWGIATEEALGGKAGSFMKAYAGAQDEAVETALESWPIAIHLWKFAKNYSGLERAWVGKAEDLRKALDDRVTDEALKRSKDWPKVANKLSEQINRLAPSLREVGVIVEKVSGSRREGRKIRIYYLEPEIGDDGDDDGDDTREMIVTEENPIDKGNSADGDDGDGGDDKSPGDWIEI